MTCVAVAYWRHPMELFTVFIFAFAFLYLAWFAYEKQAWIYAVFSGIGLAFLVLVYYINYMTKICWNDQFIVYQVGDKEELRLKWADIEEIGGMTVGKFGVKRLGRKELMKSSFFTSKQIYISTKKTDRPPRSMQSGDNMAFQIRPGLLETVERLAGVEALP